MQIIIVADYKDIKYISCNLYLLAVDKHRSITDRISL